MQKRTAAEVRDKRRVGNWSGTGAGKTGSAILASRVIGARVTLIVGANATIERVWCKEIGAMYPDSAVYTHVPDEIHPIKPNYIVLNYEKFQVSSARTLTERLVALGIDFVVLDEIQRAKQRDNNPSKRRERLEDLMCALSEQNADLCVLGMSATPVINNLVEAKKLLELVMGHYYDDLGTKATVSNALAMRRALILNGFRYRPDYGTRMETKPIRVVANHLRDELGAALNPLHVEQVLLPAKLEAVAPYVRKGTVLYTHYTTGIITPARDYFEARGYSVGVFTGAEKTGLDAFMEGKADILLGSEPVGTGVDGLQEVSDRIVVLSLPWTSAARDQLQGRIVRPGGAFDEVFMFVPQVILDNNGETWSWDETRMRAINHKRALADCAIDGRVPTSLSLSQTELLRRSKEALEAWMTRLEKDGPFIVERAKLEVPLPPELREKAQVRYGDFTKMNNRWSNSNSTTVYERLTEDPTEWRLYHDYYREARAEWEEIPAEYIASQLRARSDLRIGDFGCGECLLRDALPKHNIVGLDYVPMDETVTACDVAKTPLEDSSLGAAVFSLSLMGRNWPEYLAEAYRTLQPFGPLFVAEPEKRWGQEGKLEKALEEAGFSIHDSRQRGAFRYITAMRNGL